MRWYFALAVALSGTTAVAATVVGSKHDLSARGPGDLRAATETDPCVFCHASHGAPDGNNRPDIGRGHRPYESTTSRTRASAPTGASRICLSCHDGTIAIGQTATRRIRMTVADDRIPASSASHLGTDLRRMHPISVPVTAGARQHPPVAGDEVRLDRSGLVQCTSCHDPHDEYGGNPGGKFLVKTTNGSALCVSCHSGELAAAGTTHLTRQLPAMAPAGKTMAASPGSAGQGCGMCHVSHGADAGGRLLAKRDAEPASVLCLRCHDGSEAQDVRNDVAKPSSHLVAEGRHDASEGPDNRVHRLPEASPAAGRHATCTDCHDPHASTSGPSSAAGTAAALAGVWGIDVLGRRVEAASFEYEVCFKCHADSSNRSGGGSMALGRPMRAVEDTNLRKVFDPAGPSHHPIAAPGLNPDVPSLISPLTASSQIKCSDCHASDSGRGAGGTGPRGPHGSNNPFMLERAYSTADFTVESPAAYALCYKCHDREVLLSRDSAFPLHARHVVDETAPCSACHAAHGVSSQAGNPRNNAHLLSFDVNIVKPSGDGVRNYESLGARAGSCAVTCHAVEHARWQYPVTVQPR